MVERHSPHLIPYRFQKGNKLAIGRPGKTRNQLEPIRRRILQVVKRRIFREKNLDTVSTNDLLKFLASIMPKDYLNAQQATQINYISNVPREEEVPEVSIQPLTEPLPEETKDEPAL